MTTPDLFNLHGKIALVTGGSRGIGESICRVLAAHGAHVIVSSRRLENCESIAASIRGDGGSAEALSSNIGDLDQIEALFDKISRKHGRLEILVNNAATNPYFGHILDTDVISFQKTIDVNVRGYFFSSVRGARLMATCGGGSIVNVASVNAIVPGEMQGIYSVTKAAVVSMTKAFAVECASSEIRVNALLPGATDTKFASALIENPEKVNRILSHVPMKRVAQPDEMSGAVLYLVSDAARYTTGVCLNVDGGYLVG